MSKDLSALIDEIGHDFEEFKKELRDEVKAIETKGHADPVLTEKIEKMAKAIEGLDAQKSAIDEQKARAEEQQKKIDELVERLNQPISTGEKGESLPQEIKDATNRYLRKGRLEDLEVVNQKMAEHFKSLNLSTAEEGGIFYSFTHDMGIIPLIYELAPMRQVCDLRSISTSSYTFKRQTGESGSGWVGEMESRDETTAPTYAQQEIEVHECYAQPMVTQKMLEDAEFDVEGEINNDLAKSFAKLENEAFLTGNGVKKPRGLLTYTFSTTPTSQQVLYVATGASGDWAATDPHIKLLGISELLKAEYVANAAWMMRRAQVAEVMKFVDGEKRPIWQPSYQAGVPSNLVGFPVIRNEHLPTKAANSYSVTFGDYKQAYRIVDRRGAMLLRDPYTQKPFIKYYTTRRVGGDVVQKEAFLALKFASS